MAILIGDNFSYQGAQPNFARDSVATKALLKAATAATYDEGHLVFCAEDQNVYVFLSKDINGADNPQDADTGYFKLFAGSGSSESSIQVLTLPAANADNTGKIYQYVGETTSDYKQGLFYICVEVPDTADPPGDPTYEWQKIDCCEGMNEIVTDDNGKGLMSSDMKKMLDELWEKANPTVFTVTGNKRERNSGTHTMAVGWSLKKGDTDINVDQYTVTINDQPEATNTGSKNYTGLTANTTYTVKATYDGKEYSGTASLTLYEDYQLFYGMIAADKDPAALTEDEIKALTPINQQTTLTRSLRYDLQNQKAVYAFPSALGSVKQINDTNGFNYFGEDSRSFGTDAVATVQITADPAQTTATGPLEYKVYAMRDAATNPMTFEFK